MKKRDKNAARHETRFVQKTLRVAVHSRSGKCVVVWSHWLPCRTKRMSDHIVHNLLRGLGADASDGGDTQSKDSAEFSGQVFWPVTALILTGVLLASVWCYCFGGKDWLTRQTNSDEEYRNAVLRRREREQEARRDNPEKRRKKLLQSFRRCQVHMIVEASDLRSEDTVETTPTVSPTNSSRDGDVNDDEEHGGGSDELRQTTDQIAPVDIDFENAATHGFLVLRHPDQKPRSVPNCCAICLGSYEVGERVVWSSNEECQHAFHADCITDWLTKMLDGTPCPCCRADFTDLEKFRRERRVVWKAGPSFDPHAISLR